MVVQLLDGTTTIKLSKASYELFMNFIQRKEMWSMLAVCNEFLRFDIQSSVLSPKDIRPVEGLLVKDTGDEGLRINAEDIQLGLLKGSFEDILVSRALDASVQVCSFLSKVPARMGVSNCGHMWRFACRRSLLTACRIPHQPWHRQRI
jgi:hypothetical protein